MLASIVSIALQKPCFLQVQDRSCQTKAQLHMWSFSLLPTRQKNRSQRVPNDAKRLKDTHQQRQEISTYLRPSHRRILMEQMKDPLAFIQSAKETTSFAPPVQECVFLQSHPILSRTISGEEPHHRGLCFKEMLFLHGYSGAGKPNSPDLESGTKSVHLHFPVSNSQYRTCP